jgi:predicted Zn-dependent protease
MTEAKDPSGCGGEASQGAVALVTAFALASASRPVRAQGVPRGSRDPRRRNRAAAARLPGRSCAPRALAAEYQVTIINDRSFNAFVMDGASSSTPAAARRQDTESVIGVLAHETGHIAGGHLSRLRQLARQWHRRK